jgi:DegV family protein with EDD domain
MTVGLVSTSVSALPQDKISEYGIKVVPVPFSLDGHRYLDGVDIPASEIYKQMAYELPFRTSSPPPLDYLKAFNDMSKTVDEILCLTISRQFSMMYSSALSAAQDFSERMNIAVVDTETAAGGQALIDLALARMIEVGANLKECSKTVEKLTKRVQLLGLISEPKYVARTGRVPSLVPKVASAIGIKPIIAITKGKAKLVRIARTINSGVDHMLNIMRQKSGNNPLRVIVQHANLKEEADDLMKRVENEFNCREVFITEFSPVMGFATGPGTLVLSFLPDED